ncbi:MAG: hypothetical protein M1319_02160 [Chloroflexi bacterium]|nr:hypothetical protein [Chloroflexota bacterium]
MPLDTRQYAKQIRQWPYMSQSVNTNVELGYFLAETLPTSSKLVVMSERADEFWKWHAFYEGQSLAEMLTAGTTSQGIEPTEGVWDDLPIHHKHDDSDIEQELTGCLAPKKSYSVELEVKSITKGKLATYNSEDFNEEL